MKNVAIQLFLALLPAMYAHSQVITNEAEQFIKLLVDARSLYSQGTIEYNEYIMVVDDTPQNIVLFSNLEGKDEKYFVDIFFNHEKGFDGKNGTLGSKTINYSYKGLALDARVPDYDLYIENNNYEKLKNFDTKEIDLMTKEKYYSSTPADIRKLFVSELTKSNSAQIGQTMYVESRSDNRYEYPSPMDIYFLLQNWNDVLSHKPLDDQTIYVESNNNFTSLIFRRENKESRDWKRWDVICTFDITDGIVLTGIQYVYDGEIKNKCNYMNFSDIENAAKVPMLQIHMDTIPIENTLKYTVRWFKKWSWNVDENALDVPKDKYHRIIDKKIGFIFDVTNDTSRPMSSEEIKIYKQ